MNGFLQAFGVELLKTRRSRLPWITALAFSIAPFAGGFFMIVLKDPDVARRAGIISAKAQIVAGTADWPAYFGFLEQAVAVGGIILFGLVASWVFGREFSDRTVNDLLALPTPRHSIVLAKFAITILWSACLTVIITMEGLIIGSMISLPLFSPALMINGLLSLAETACMTITIITPVALAASAGRGYLAPMGIAILAVVLAQIVAVAGWGEYFPWAIPALHAGMGEAGAGTISGAGIIIVALTGIIGIGGTVLWWNLADQSR